MRLDKIKRCLAYDDVLLVPNKLSTGLSRLDMDLSTLVGNLNLKIPIVSSPMDTVTESEMAIEIGRLGGLGILHRFNTPQEQAEMIRVMLLPPNAMKVGRSAYIAPAIGVTKDELERAKYLYNEFGKTIDMMVVDVANGYHVLMRDTVKYIQDLTQGDVQIMAGNVATEEGFLFLAELGVNAVRVGIGGGCHTADTKVLMTTGYYKNINQVIIGDWVINKFGQPVQVKGVINNGYKKVVKVCVANWKEPIYVTPEHEYWRASLSNVDCFPDEECVNFKLSWAPIGEIERGDVLLTPRNIEFDGVENGLSYYYSEVISIEECPIDMEVWDIEIDCPTHSFVANNLIVHNSICKTRIQTGFGMPTLASIDDCADAAIKTGVSIIADGGIKYPSDVAKGIAAGASAVMCGGILAGTKESPGEVIYDKEGEAWKKYRGMASTEVQNEKRGGMKKGTCAEGVSTLIPYQGSLKRVIEEFTGGIRSALTYNNSKTLDNFRETALFVEITGSGLSESHAYGTVKR